MNAWHNELFAIFMRNAQMRNDGEPTAFELAVENFLINWRNRPVPHLETLQAEVSALIAENKSLSATMWSQTDKIQALENQIREPVFHAEKIRREADVDKAKLCYSILSELRDSVWVVLDLKPGVAGADIGDCERDSLGLPSLIGADQVEFLVHQHNDGLKSVAQAVLAALMEPQP